MKFWLLLLPLCFFNQAFLTSCRTDVDTLIVDVQYVDEAKGVQNYPEIKQWFTYLCSDELGGRYSGSKGIKKAADYIANVINDNISLKRVIFEAKNTSLENIIYCVKGKTDSLIVIGAHYDAYGFIDKKPRPGADDNMSGVAVLLRMIKMIQKSDISPHYSIAFCFFDGEEIGMLGARHFIGTNKDPIKIYVNVDTCGSINDYELTLSYNSSYPELKDQFSYLAMELGALPIMEYAPLGYATDCSAFKGCRFIAIGPLTIPSYLHTMNDDISNISLAKIDRISKALIPLIY